MQIGYDSYTGFELNGIGHGEFCFLFKSVRATNYTVLIAQELKYCADPRYLSHVTILYK